MRKILVFLIVFNLLNFAKEQGLPELFPPSLNAAALAEYADVPVSLFSGTPQIEIPKWEFKGKDINIPISFSYHADGIKVNEVPSWVGLGWVINTGGVITRTIKGKKEYVVNGEIFPKRDLPIKGDNTTADFPIYLFRCSITAVSSTTFINKFSLV